MASLLENASTRLRASLRGTVALVSVDGQGALVTPTMGWRTAAKWAQARQSLGIVNKDITLITQRLETLVVRPGTTFAQTGGSAKALADLRQEMVQAGFDANDWSFPRNLDDVLAATRGEPAPGKRARDARKARDEAAEGEARTASVTPTKPPS